jgi:histidyl-tRNA synthetase
VLQKMLGSSLGCDELHELLALANFYGIRDWISFDPSVVRGLSYYTGVVFEGVDRAVS